MKKKNVTDSIVDEAQRRYKELGVADDFSYRIQGAVIHFGTANRVDWRMPQGFEAVKKECTEPFVHAWAKRYEPHLSGDPEEVYERLRGKAESVNELADLALSTRKYDYVMTDGTKIWGHVYSAENKWLRTGPLTLKKIIDRDVYRWNNFKGAWNYLNGLLASKKLVDSEERKWGIVRIGRSSAPTVACSRIEWTEGGRTGLGVGVAKTTVVGAKGP